jgi:hypothetical protein
MIASLLSDLYFYLLKRDTKHPLRARYHDGNPVIGHHLELQVSEPRCSLLNRPTKRRAVNFGLWSNGQNHEGRFVGSSIDWAPATLSTPGSKFPQAAVATPNRSAVGKMQVVAECFSLFSGVTSGNHFSLTND